MTDQSSTINLEEAARFLTRLDPEATRFTFQTFDDRKAADKQSKVSRALARVRHGTLAELASTLTGANEDGAGIYVALNETDFKGREAGNIRRVRAVCVDLDNAPLEPVVDHTPPPHMVVETSPGRFQAFWIVDGLELDEFTPIQLAIAAKFGGDPKVADLPHVFRLPGFLHNKGKPFLARIEHISDEPPYKADVFRGEQAAEQIEVIEEGSRNTSLTSWAGVLRQRGLPAAALQDVLMTLNQHLCETPLEPGEIAAIAKSAGKWKAGSVEVQELNAEFAVTWAGTSAVILREGYDAELGRKTVWFVKKEDLALMLANRSIQGGNKPIPLFEHWLKHPERRQYSAVVFAPGREVPGAYNMWRGWAVQPDPTGSCQLFLAHLRNVICDKDEEVYRWVLGWLADAVQHPDVKPGTAIVMRGLEGSGKGLFVQYIGVMYGEHFVHLQQGEHLVGRFNAQLKGCALCFADEALFAGNRSHGNVLKGLITEPTLMLEMKYVNAFPVANRVRLIMASNEDWVLATGLNARRFCVLEVPMTERENAAYFEALAAEMQAGGPAALMAYLTTIDLTGIDLRNPPKTAALMDQKHLTMTPVQKWWYERLLNGYLLNLEDENWITPVEQGLLWLVGKDVYDDYLKHARDSNARFRDTPESFGKAIGKLCPTLVRKKKWMKVKYYHPVELDWIVETKLVNAHGYPPLAECRQAFERVLGHKVDWPEDDRPLPTRPEDEEMPF